MTVHAPVPWLESKECREGVASCQAILDMLAGRPGAAPKVPTQPDPVLDLGPFDEAAMMSSLVAHGWQPAKVKTR